MDPADTQRALSGQGAAISRHEQSIQIAHDSISQLAHSVNELVQQLKHVPCSEPASNSRVGGAAGFSDSYTCDPEPYDGDLSKCRGFVLQCQLVFSQRAHLFPTDRAKVNYIIGLLRGRALAWAQASAGASFDSLSLDAFLARPF